MKNVFILATIVLLVKMLVIGLLAAILLYKITVTLTSNFSLVIVTLFTDILISFLLLV